MRMKEGLPAGYYTLGDGHIHKVPTTGYSKWYKRDDYKFRYDNAEQQLEVYYNGEKIDTRGLNFMDWIENPDYWVDDYLEYIKDFAQYELGDVVFESDQLNEEDQSFVIAYREGGQDKYSSVQASSSADALRIFNSLIDKAGRHVNNAHIAVEDVELDEDNDTGLPPLRSWSVVREFDGEEIELAKLKARNEDEAKASMLIALLDAGYYENEIEPEISNGTIKVKPTEDINEGTTPEKVFKVEYHYNYEDEIDEFPYARSAIFISSKLVRASSSEEALEKMESQKGQIANQTPGINGYPYNFEIVGVWDSLEDYKRQYPLGDVDFINESKMNIIRRKYPHKFRR